VLTKYDEQKVACKPDAFRGLVKGLLRYVASSAAGEQEYTLRHVFETAAGEDRDQAVVVYFLGRACDAMASINGERISGEGLRR
jgi:hypothetical protein